MQCVHIVFSVLIMAWSWSPLVNFRVGVDETLVLICALRSIDHASELSLHNSSLSIIRAWGWSIHLLDLPRILRRSLAEMRSEKLGLNILEFLKLCVLAERRLAGIPFLCVSEYFSYVPPNHMIN